MKFLITALTLFSLSSYASAELTKSQLSQAAEDLDNICGDTWCEGDFNWSVDELRCDLAKGTCTVDLTLKDTVAWDDEEIPSEFNQFTQMENFDWDNDTYEKVLTYSSSCTLIDMNSVEDVLSFDGYEVYSQKLYESVGECTLEVEDEYRAILSRYSIDR